MLGAPPSPLQIGLSFALPLIVLLGVAYSLRSGPVTLPSFDRYLAGRISPIVLGVISAVTTLFVWGSLREPGVVHDEHAYLLQAEIFSTFRWTGEPPPVSQFFEQPHVFVEPRLASKYPPAHSFALVPGIWVGLPGLIPVVLAGVSGGLIFAIARTISTPAFAAALWLLCCTSGASLFWRASYFSQNTSLTLWLVTLWALLRWRASRRTAHLGVVACSLAGMYLTRPLTAVALSVPVGICVLGVVTSRGTWRQLAAAAATAAPLLAINLLWQEQTLGDWFTNPYAEYSRQYFPFVKPGFGVDTTPPTRAVPPEIAWLGAAFMHLHAAHTPAALPGTLMDRSIAVLVTLMGTRTLLFAGFLWGAVRVRDGFAFGAASIAALLAAHLVYAHPANWIVYYAEVFPAIFAVALFGLYNFVQWALRLGHERAIGAVLVTAILFTPILAWDLAVARREKDTWSGFQRAAQRAVAEVRDIPAVIFVRYPPAHQHHFSLTRNTPDYRRAPVWLVHDRGERNAELLQVTDRTAFRLWTESWTLERIR